MKTDKNLLRPLNYPRGVSGYGFGVYEVPGKSVKIGGLEFYRAEHSYPLLTTALPPQQIGLWTRSTKRTGIVFLIFMLRQLPKKVSYGLVTLTVKFRWLWGTHTHIPNNDARILRAERDILPMLV